MLCPRCDQQGTVLKARIVASREVVHLCDECDALWPNGVEVSEMSFVDFSTYMNQLGLRGQWDEVEVITDTH
jgi:hypothetical protein